MTWVRADFRARPAKLGRYWSSRAASMIRSRVASLTRADGALLSTRETAEIDTPARAATSPSVAMERSLLSGAAASVALARRPSIDVTSDRSGERVRPLDQPALRAEPRRRPAREQQLAVEADRAARRREPHW